jgi:YHS domain-containing protein
MRAIPMTILAAALALGSSVATAGEGGRGEFGNQCAYGLSQGMNVKTGCSINFTDGRGKTLCFSSQQNAVKFMSNFEKNLKAAEKNANRG